MKDKTQQENKDKASEQVYVLEAWEGETLSKGPGWLNKGAGLQAGHS